MVLDAAATSGTAGAAQAGAAQAGTETAVVPRAHATLAQHTVDSLVTRGGSDSAERNFDVALAACITAHFLVISLAALRGLADGS